MKKIVIPIAAFLLFFIVVFGAVLTGAVNKQTYNRHANYHLAYSSRAAESSIATGEDGTQVYLTAHNERRFISAVTRTEMLHRIIPPRVSGLPCVSVAFPDGAVYIVYDAGMKKDEDLVYIKYTYEDTTMYFSLAGYKTFSRVCECTSPEGSNSPNEVIEP